MELVIIIILVVLLLIGAVIVSLRNKALSMNMDAISLITLVLGGSALGLLLSFNTSSYFSVALGVGIGIFAIILLVTLLVISQKTLKSIVERRTDERVNAISSKSGRNALFITYLVITVFLLTDSAALSRISMIIVLAAGLITFFASYLYYYFSKSFQ